MVSLENCCRWRIEWLGVISSRLSVPVAALVGLLSMVAGLAVGHLVGGFISPTASPFFAVSAHCDRSDPPAAQRLRGPHLRQRRQGCAALGYGGGDRDGRGGRWAAVAALAQAWVGAADVTWCGRQSRGDDDVCVQRGGWTLPVHHYFTGVLLADVLKKDGVRRGADQVFTTSVEGSTCGTPTATLTDPARQAMLVIGMNGEPLPIEHGFRFGCWSRGSTGSCPGPSGSPIWNSPRSPRSTPTGCSAAGGSAHRSRRCRGSTTPARSDGSARTR